jgi:1-acyl-sn-glycerol-3-phosphate acyltransferase
MACRDSRPLSGAGEMSAVELPLATFRLWTRYFRYETEGFETLAESEPSVIVAYHGGPWTFDLWMLGVRMYDELGYFPCAFWDRSWWRLPAVGRVITELGGLPGPPRDADIVALKSRGEHLVLAPGGTREALRPFWKRHQVDFGPRRGYLRLAREYGMPIIPVVATGVDETFLGLNDGRALSKRLFGRNDVPVWLALGVGGLWPLALPLPVRIRQHVGTPVDLSSFVDEDAAHAHLTATMQAMLDALRRS